jgi:hypothetical protein
MNSDIKIKGRERGKEKKRINKHFANFKKISELGTLSAVCCRRNVVRF